MVYSLASTHLIYPGLCSTCSHPPPNMTELKQGKQEASVCAETRLPSSCCYCCTFTLAHELRLTVHSHSIAETPSSNLPSSTPGEASLCYVKAPGESPVCLSRAIT